MVGIAAISISNASSQPTSTTPANESATTQASGSTLQVDASKLRSTGQAQAAWSVTGTSDYVALGGEFPTANGVAQQGLVRYAVSGKAPNKRGPVRPPNPTSPTASTGSGSTVVRVGLS